MAGGRGGGSGGSGGSGVGEVLRKRGQAQVGLDGPELRKQGPGLGVGEARGNDDIVARDPVDRGGDLAAELVGGLQGVEGAQDLGGVAATAGRVGHDQADLLGRVDDEDRADGQLHALVVDVGGVLVVDHVVEQGDLALRVGDDGELQAAAGDLVDVPDPRAVGVAVVDAEPDQLGVSLGELRLELGKRPELGGAHGREVVRVREENAPAVLADVVVEGHLADGRVGCEVRRRRA